MVGPPCECRNKRQGLTGLSVAKAGERNGSVSLGKGQKYGEDCIGRIRRQCKGVLLSKKMTKAEMMSNLS